MWTLRAAIAIGFSTLLSARLTTCRSPGEGGTDPSPAKTESANVTLNGVDTSALTTREKAEWSRYVSEFLTPCSDQPVSIAECVQQSRPCKACAPAARYLVDLARRGQVRAQVESTYKARFSPDAVKPLDLSGAPSKGPADAKVVMAEFADFQCPACGAARPLIEEALKKHASEVRLVFKHFPLSIHENAEKAARAAVSAGRQNKFWEMHEALFVNQQKLDSETIQGLAKGIGLDMKHFLADWDSEAVADVVARDRKQGEALGLKSTPSLFINGRPFVPGGGEFADDLDSWINLELELVSGVPAPAKATPAPSAAPAPSAGKAEPLAPTSAKPATSAAPPRSEKSPNALGSSAPRQ